MNFVSELESLRRRISTLENHQASPRSSFHDTVTPPWIWATITEAVSVGDVVVSDGYDLTNSIFKVKKPIEANDPTALVCKQGHDAEGGGVIQCWNSGIAWTNVDATGMSSGSTVGTQTASFTGKCGNTGLGVVHGTAANADGLYPVFFSNVTQKDRFRYYELNESAFKTLRSDLTVSNYCATLTYGIVNATAIYSEVWCSITSGISYIQPINPVSLATILLSHFGSLFKRYALGMSADWTNTSKETLNFNVRQEVHGIYEQWNQDSLTWNNRPISASVFLCGLAVEELHLQRNKASFFSQSYDPATNTSALTIGAHWYPYCASQSTLYGFRLTLCAVQSGWLGGGSSPYNPSFTRSFNKIKVFWDTS